MTDVFPLPSDVYGIYSMVLCYYVAWPCDLDFRPWEGWFLVQCFSCPSHIPILIILPLSVTELRLLNLMTFTLSETVTAHAPCPVTYDRGAKIVHIFEIIDPNLPIHFVTFRVLRWSISHIIGENSVYSIVKAKKFTAHAQYRVTCRPT